MTLDLLKKLELFIIIIIIIIIVLRGNKSFIEKSTSYSRWWTNCTWSNYKQIKEKN